MKSRISASLTVLVGTAVLVFAASPASAHTSLIDVQPGEGDTVREGTTVSLTFSDALLDLGTEISVTDSTGDPISLEVQRPDPASVAATLPALAAGAVTVSWRVVAGDGHPIVGTLAYVAEAPSVPEPAAPSASASAAETPAMVSTSPTPAPSSSPSPSPQPDAENDASGSGINWGVWIAVGVAIFAATGAGVATKKRR